MTEMRTFDRDEISGLISMGAAIDALHDCFTRRPSHVARCSYPIAGGEFLVMPATDDDFAGVKLLMVQPANAARGAPVIQGMYVLFDAASGRPSAVLDGAALTTLRTPAASAIATDALARADVTTLGIIGSGPQAFAHVRAMLCVRPHLERVVVAGRTAANARSIVDRLTVDQDSHVAGGDTPRRFVVGSWADAAACDVVCVATRSIEPLIVAAMVRPGTHVNAVGSYRSDMRELAAELVAASTVAVDELAAAQHEAGDLIQAVAAGLWSWDRVAGDLAALATEALVRTDDDEITVFKSVGLAVQDLVIARAVVRAANVEAAAGSGVDAPADDSADPASRR